MTGSAMYMCPEVWGRQPYNEKADVFSFGVLLYELTGRTMLTFTHLNNRVPGVSGAAGHVPTASSGKAARMYGRKQSG